MSRISYIKAYFHCVRRSHFPEPLHTSCCWSFNTFFTAPRNLVICVRLKSLSQEKCDHGRKRQNVQTTSDHRSLVLWALTPPHCFQLCTNTHKHTHGQGQWSTGGQHSWTAVVQLCEWWRCWAAINVTCWRMMTEPTLECWTTLTPLCSSLFYSICMISFICLGLSLTQIMLVQTWGRSTPKNIQNILK